MASVKMNNIVIWGAGEGAREFVQGIDLNKNKIIFVVDSNKEKIGGVIFGVPIISPEEVKEISFDILIICSLSEVEIIEQCINLGISNYVSCRNVMEIVTKYPVLFNDEKICSLYSSELQKLDWMAKYNLENMWRNIFIDTVNGYDWYKVMSISLGRWAIGYNYAYVLARVLDSFNPTSILELGLGQSSKIISSYVSNSKLRDVIQYDVVEQDQNWIEFFKKENCITDEMTVYQRSIVQTNLLGGIIYMYDNFDSVIQGKKYSFISIDGPWGGDNLSRMEVCSNIPDILQKDFIIMIDDYNRYGEQLMVLKMEKKLRDCGIKFYSEKYEGIKDIYIIVSSEWHFLTSL